MKTTKAKSYCNQCVGERSHEILHKETQSGGESFDDGFRIEWETSFHLLKCCGCESISLRRTSSHSDDTDEDGRPLFTVSYFPPAKFRREPTWLSDLQVRELLGSEQTFIADMLKEIYVCIQNDCRRSAAMGVRALLEHVMIDKVQDQGSFVANIKKFESEGFIAPKQRQFLETVIEAGHATMHRSFNPSREDLISLVNIAEALVETAYVNEHEAAELKKRIPPKRQQRTDKSP